MKTGDDVLALTIPRGGWKLNAFENSVTELQGAFARLVNEHGMHQAHAALVWLCLKVSRERIPGVKIDSIRT